MPIFLVTVLTKLGIPERLRGAAIVGLILIVAVALAFGAAVWLNHWVDAGKTEAVAADRNAVNAVVMNRQIVAEREATLNQMQADAAFRNSQEELNDVVKDKSNGSAAGPATVSVIERMRQQQQAGRR